MLASPLFFPFRSQTLRLVGSLLRRLQPAGSGLSLAVLSLTLLVGCGDSAPPAPEATTTGQTTVGAASAQSASSSAARAQGQALLAEVRQTYRDAQSYADNSTVVFYAVARATGSANETPYTRSSIALQRPNLLHVTLKNSVGSPTEEHYEIVSDGKVVRSIAAGADNQVHEAIAPQSFSTNNFLLDPALREELLKNTLENTWPQLAMLLSSDKAAAVFQGEAEAYLLSDAKLDGKTYQRIEIPSPAGKRVLWIDPKQKTLRRMVIPTANQDEKINGRKQFSEYAVWIDFENIALDLEIDADTFELAIPVDSRRVRRFIEPPEAGPSENLGKLAGEFAFETLAGEAVTRESLAGKVVVLDFWLVNCPHCRTQTPVMQQVYEKFKDNKDVAFYAVNMDNHDVPNKATKNILASWDGELPILRDPKSTSSHELGVRNAPSLLLLDRKGRLQLHEVGAHGHAGPVIERIQQLVDGADLAALNRSKYADYLVRYEQMLDAATVQDTLFEGEVVRPEIPARQLPEGLSTKQLWQSTAEQIKRPGDVLLVNEADAGNKKGSFRLLVLDGGQAIVEFDDTGKQIGRHELPEHSEQSRGFLRTWSNAAGERWTLACGVGWQQVHAFDPNWKLLFSFPDEKHAGIGDVRFDELSGSGTPLMVVGYWGGLGMQAGTLDGQIAWTNRRLNHILQIGPGPDLADGTRTHWCTSTRGTLTQFDAAGKSLEERYVSGQALMYFASQSAALKNPKRCGLSVGKAGQYTAVGFDETNKPSWEYPLPTGEYAEPLPRIQAVQLPSGDQGWLVVAANGSLHWLTDTGKLLAKFEYGEIVTGVAMKTVGDQTVLLVATAKHLTAWEVKSAESAGKPAVEEQAAE